MAKKKNAPDGATVADATIKSTSLIDRTVTKVDNFEIVRDVPVLFIVRFKYIDHNDKVQSRIKLIMKYKGDTVSGFCSPSTLAKKVRAPFKADLFLEERVGDDGKVYCNINGISVLKQVKGNSK